MRNLIALLFLACLPVLGLAENGIPATYKKGDLEVQGKAFLALADDKSGNIELRFKSHAQGNPHQEICMLTALVKFSDPNKNAVLSGCTSEDLPGQQVPLWFFEYLLNPESSPGQPIRPTKREGLASSHYWLEYFLGPERKKGEDGILIAEVVRIKPAYPDMDPKKNAVPDSLTMKFSDFQKLQKTVDKLTKKNISEDKDALSDEHTRGNGAETGNKRKEGVGSNTSGSSGKYGG